MAIRKAAAAKAPEAPPAPPSKSTKPTEAKSEGERAPRGPRQDYGYKKGATINITDAAAEKKYRGKRLEYFEILKKHNGKTVEKFYAACPEGDPPRGWLRFFVQDGAAVLEGGEDDAE